MRFKTFAKSLETDPSKKEEILNAAQTVFASVGFKEATVRQICKKAKANVCLVSYYFGGKDGLYRSLFERMYKKFSINYQKILGEDDIKSIEDYKARLLIYIEQVYGNMLENKEFVALVHRELSGSAHSNNSVALKFVSENQEKLLQFFLFGQKKKYFKKDVDPHLASSILMSLLSSFVQQQQTNQCTLMLPDTDQKDIPEKILKTIVTIYFGGVFQ